MTYASLRSVPPERLRALLEVASEEEAEALVSALEGELAEEAPEAWLRTVLPGYFPAPFASHHEVLLDWAWAIRAGERARPFLAVWARGAAKALAVETEIPTPSGWVAMGDIEPGDEVFDHRGQPTRVLAVSPVETVPCARLSFSGRASLVASLDHRWAVLSTAARRALPEGVDWALDSWPQRMTGVCVVPGCGWPTRRGRMCSAHAERQRRGVPLDASPISRWTTARPVRQAQVMTTAELEAGRLRSGPAEKRAHQWAIPTTEPLQLPEARLPVDPYVLGVWLGDGTTAAAVVTSGLGDAEEMHGLLLARGAEVRVAPHSNAVSLKLPGLQPLLRSAGLGERKFIPSEYLRGSEEQRLALLRGLLDTDGSVGNHGSSATFASTNRSLAEGAAELARSLGCRVSIGEGRARLNGRDCGPVWRLCIGGATPKMFGLQRKASLLAERAERALPWSGRAHMISAIERVPDQPARCITVASPAGLYLAGRAMIPTHNSTLAEAICVMLGCRARRQYGLYVSRTQENQADVHVANVGAMLESEQIGRLYPQMAARAVTQYGHSKGWRRNRLRTASGFTLDALGLDTDIRGVKMDQQRPDWIVVDDVDHPFDSPAMVRKKLDALALSLFPAGSDDLTVLVIQNLVHENGVIAQIHDGRAEMLADRITSGPIPAIEGAYDLQPTGDDEHPWRIVGGEPTWVGQDREACERRIANVGPTAWASEAQHKPRRRFGGIFDEVMEGIEHCPRSEVPDLVIKAICVDPAVVDSDASDAHGVQCDGLAPDGRIFRLRSWERRASPGAALEIAICWAYEEGVADVGVEMMTGVDLSGRSVEESWRNAFAEAHKRVLVAHPEWRGQRPPQVVKKRASSALGSKAARVSAMLVDYETPGRIVHVIGDHEVLESAMARFPVVKPFDLCDAAYYSWAELRGYGGPPGTSSAVLTSMRIDQG